MPRLVQQVMVFISCTSELGAEKRAAKEVVREVNRLLPSDSVIQFAALADEDDIVSGIGADAQEVINQQLPDYDIYVGMMGNRFGSQTPRAGSGTEEEFDNAYKRYRQGDEIDIMFFFKKAAVLPDELDIDQWIRVRDFKSNIGRNGVLYREFSSLDELQTHLRQGLLHYATEWTKRLAITPRETVPEDGKTAALREIDDGFEAGPVDLLADMEQAMDNAEEALASLAQGGELLAAALNQRNGEIEALTSTPNTPSHKRTRKVIDEAAQDLVNYAVTMEKALPSFRDTIGVFADRAARLVDASIADDVVSVGDLQQARTAYGSLVDSMREAIVQFYCLRETIAETPSLTSSVRSAIRRALGAMDPLLSEMRTEMSTLEQMLLSLDMAIRQRHNS